MAGLKHVVNSRLSPPCTVHRTWTAALIGRFPLPRRRASEPLRSPGPDNRFRHGCDGKWRIFRPAEEDRTQGAVPQSVRPQSAVHPASRSLLSFPPGRGSSVRKEATRRLEPVEMARPRNASTSAMSPRRAYANGSRHLETDLETLAEDATLSDGGLPPRPPTRCLQESSPVAPVVVSRDRKASGGFCDSLPRTQ